MPVRRIDPRQQFSKWLARYGSIAWGVFLLLVVILLFFRPETAASCVYLVLIVTVNKALDTLSYTDNSKTEKILLAGLERTKIELKLNGIGKSKAAGNDETGEAETTDEEGGNG